ncbi:hypothetical protein V5799_020584 [Amblyomma americanum]|uniref:Uncharacterized protein n=1 Tax=Amblyomma americanum TaxID=6943 RepID=A0AAQ4EUB7_AMBAM
MPKKRKIEKSATGDKKANRRHSRSSKVVSPTMSPDPTAVKGGPSSPLPTTGDLAPDGTNAHEEPAAASGQALKPHNVDQRLQRAPAAVTELSLRSPDEPTAMASRPDHPEPEAPASEETLDAQKGSDNSPPVTLAAEAQKAPAPVLASELLVGKQDKPTAPDPVTAGPPRCLSEAAAAGVSVMPQGRIIAQGPCTSTVPPPLATAGSLSAERPQPFNQGNTERNATVRASSGATSGATSGVTSGVTSGATSGAMSPSVPAVVEARSKTQCAAQNALTSASRPTMTVMRACFESLE